MKKYCAENLTTIPKRYLDPSTGCNNGKGFPDRWLELFDEEFCEYFSQSKDTVYRWYLLFSIIGTESFSKKFDFHGLCPSCSYPFVYDKSLRGGSQHTENKLSCKECMKEIDWTYYASPSEMKVMRNFLHPRVLGDIDKIIKECSPMETDKPTEETPLQKIHVKKPLTNKTNKVLSLIHDDIRSETESTTITTVSTIETSLTSSLEKPHIGDKPSRKRGRRKEHDIDKIIHIAREQLKNCKIYTERTPLKIDEDNTDNSEGKPDTKNYDMKIKDAIMNLLAELKNFQGVSLEKIPFGVFQSVESYMQRIYKIPSKDEIRREPLNDKGERTVSNLTISRRMVLEALRECGLNKWTSHISHIMATLWWCPYPKIEHEHEEKMLILFVKQREIFERIKDKFARKSNLSVFTAMGKLLTLCEYPYDDMDFKIWETQDSKKKQDLMWEECVKEFHQN
jgi:hypothetical protein